MNIALIAPPSAFDQALEIARRVGHGGKIEGLNAVIDAGLIGKVDEVWGSIEKALKAAYRHGKEQVQGALEAAIAKAEQMLAEAGARAHDLHHILLEKMQAFMQAFIQRAITLVPRNINVGDFSLPLRSLKCTQKISLTGSVKTSLVELFALVSVGELSIEAEYAEQPKQSPAT